MNLRKMYSVHFKIATVVQSFIYGFSITNLGLGIGLFVMFVAYAQKMLVINGKGIIWLLLK